MTSTTVYEADADPQEYLFSIEVPRPGIGYSFHVDLVDSYCGTPSCPCNVAILRPRSVQGRALDGVVEELRDVKFYVNLESGIAKPAAEEPSELVMLVCAAVNQDIDDELLEEMRKGYAWTKRRGREEKAWRDKDWSHLNPGGTLAWSELFPSDGAFPVGEEARFAVADRYCWNPDCHCQNSLLCLCELEGDEYVERASFFYNLKTEKTDFGGGDKQLVEKYRTLLLAWLDETPSIPETLQERYDYVKSEFGSMLREKPVLASTKKVGRNDLCPCGSGKKYKKCCLK